jgi:peptide/nickel transport system substrate-binding protein
MSFETDTPKVEVTQHMRIFKLVLAALGVAVTAAALAACGSDSGSGSTSTTKTSSGGAAADTSGLANVAPSSDQKRGGTLKIVSAEGWSHLDPGQAYFQIDYLVTYATQRPLYSFKPDDASKSVPDLAERDPEISADGKTVTVHIRPNIKFSPPVNRVVTSDDVKYAFERDFNPNVPNGYAAGYYLIAGADKSKGGPISGIETPDKTTIVFHLTQSFGATFAKALTLPGSAPVPTEYAKYDKKSPVKYDSDPTAQAFTGPYMIKTYNAGRSLTLVRNPNWDPKTDYRPAYADTIVWKAGGDANVLARQTLNSTDLLMADGPPAPVLKTAYQTKKSQLSIASNGNYYATLNTQVPPFNNVNLRRAAVAAANRQAYLLARGGQLVGTVATHFMGPEVGPAFEAAGGKDGFGFDFLKSPTGDMAVAQKYMKLAGYPSGKYTGTASVLIVGSNSEPGPKEMQIVQAGLQALGFKTTIKAVPQQTMYSKFCGYVKAHVTVCPTVGWGQDFPDGYAYLYVPFSGKTIVPVGNVNWAELDDPKIDAAMDQAAAVTDPTARAKAWANVDKMITSTAPAIPEIWSSNALVKGSTVKGVLAGWNNNWDLSFSSVG